MLTFSHSILAGEVRIRFSEKPDEKIRAMLKANGFRWSPAAGLWWRKRVSGAADFLGALDRAINPHRPDGACWRCQSPQGFFRRQGAATPVYCDECFALAKAGQGPLGTNDGQYDRSDLDYEDRCRDACGL